MHTLLVPVDGSPSAGRALQFALAQARRNADTELLLLHVQLPVQVYGEIAVYVGDAKAREMAAEHSHELLDPAVAVARGAGVPHRQRLVEGEVAAAIARVAHEEGCESIIMGTRGLGPVASLVLGSVALKVVHLVDVPVTLVK